MQLPTRPPLTRRARWQRGSCTELGAVALDGAAGGDERRFELAVDESAAGFVCSCLGKELQLSTDAVPGHGRIGLGVQQGAAPMAAHFTSYVPPLFEGNK